MRQIFTPSLTAKRALSPSRGDVARSLPGTAVEWSRGLPEHLAVDRARLLCQLSSQLASRAQSWPHAQVPSQQRGPDTVCCIHFFRGLCSKAS